MAGLSDYAENKIIDWLLRGQAYTPPATVYVALLTASTNDAGSPFTEVSGGSYARVAVTSNTTNWSGTQGAGTTTVSSGTGGAISNNAAITFPAPTANWGTVVHAALMDASTGGNIIADGALGTSKTVNNGDPAPAFAAGQLTFTIG